MLPGTYIHTARAVYYIADPGPSADDIVKRLNRLDIDFGRVGLGWRAEPDGSVTYRERVRVELVP